MTGEPCNSWLMYSLRHVLFRIIGWWKLSSLTGHCCLMWNACFVECAHSRNVALSSWLSCSGSCNESIQCSFLTEMWTETLFGTFTTIYGVAWVFSCRAGLLPSKTGFRKLYGDGLSQRLCEKRCNWLERGKKSVPFHRLQPAGTSARCACWNEATNSSPWAPLTCWTPAVWAWAIVLLLLLHLHH